SEVSPDVEQDHAAAAKGDEGVHLTDQLLFVPMELKRDDAGGVDADRPSLPKRARPRPSEAKGGLVHQPRQCQAWSPESVTDRARHDAANKFGGAGASEEARVTADAASQPLCHMRIDSSVRVSVAHRGSKSL